MNLILDTNIVIEFFREKKREESGLYNLREEKLGLSIISYAELWYGSLRADNSAQEQMKINECLEVFEIKLLPLSQSVVRLYAKVRRDLEIQGERLDDFDLFIGATAVVTGARLVTRNKRHFERFPGLKLYGL